MSSLLLDLPLLSLSNGQTRRARIVREAEDRITLRDDLTPSEGSTLPLFETLTLQMNLTSLLDLPLPQQTRRVRIVKAILDNPKLLLLDEPYSNYLKYHILRIIIFIRLGSWT